MSALTGIDGLPRLAGTTDDVSSRILLLAVRHQLGSEVSGELEGLIPRVSDWGALLDTAGRHGVAAMLLRTLKREPMAAAIPPEARGILSGANLALAGFVVRSLQSVRDVLAHVMRAAPSTVLLKGAAVGLLAYGDPLVRPFGDVDLLLAEEEWPQARESLLGMGYEPGGRDMAILPPRLIPEDMLDHWLRFRHPAGVPVECKLDHLELGLRSRTLAEAFSSATAIELEGVTVRALSPEHQIASLCLHLNRHGFARLVWFADIVAFAKAGTCDAERLSEICRAEGVSPCVRGTLGYVSRLLGSSEALALADAIPVSMPRRLLWSSVWPSGKALSCSARRDAAMVFTKRLSSPWLIPNLLLLDRARDKARYFARKVFPPPEYIAQRIPSTRGRANYARQLLLRYVAAVAGLRTGGTSARREPAPDAVSAVLPAIRATGPVPDGVVVSDTGIAGDPMRRPRASVVVPTYEHERAHLLVDCLEGLEGQTESDFEVILVSNGPNTVVERLKDRAWRFDIRMVVLAANYRPAAADNIGALLARAPIICFLDDDAIPASNWVREHLNAHESVAVAARGGIVPRAADSSINSIEFGPLGATTVSGAPHLLDREGNMSIDREVFLAVGGFDPTLRGQHGAELTYRLVQSGTPVSRIVAWPEALIRHDHGSGVFDLLEKHFRWSRNAGRLAVTNPGFASFVAGYAANRAPHVSTGPRDGVSRRLAKVAGRVGWHVGEISAIASSRAGDAR